MSCAPARQAQNCGLIQLLRGAAARRSRSLIAAPSPWLRDRRDRDPLSARGVERAKIGKQMGRGLDEVPGRRKIESRAWPPALERAAEIERGFVRPRRWPRRVEAQPWAHSATPIARARSERVRAAPAASIGEPSADSIASRVIAPGRSNWGRPPRQATIVELDAMAAWPSVKDPVDPAVEVGDDMSGGCRAHRAGSVGGWRRKRHTRRLDQRPRGFVRRRANRHGVKAGAREQADP